MYDLGQLSKVLKLAEDPCYPPSPAARGGFCELQIEIRPGMNFFPVRLIYSHPRPTAVMAHINPFAFLNSIFPSKGSSSSTFSQELGANFPRP